LASTLTFLVKGLAQKRAVKTCPYHKKALILCEKDETMHFTHKMTVWHTKTKHKKSHASLPQTALTRTKTSNTIRAIHPSYARGTSTCYRRLHFRGLWHTTQRQERLTLARA